MKRLRLLCPVLVGLLASSCTETVEPPIDTFVDDLRWDFADVAGDDVGDWTDAPACPEGTQSCGGACVNTQTDVGNCGACGNRCPSGQVCSGGRCEAECAAGYEDCSGSCVDLGTDGQNCGECGNACPAAPHATGLCEIGLCGIRCEPGWSDVTAEPGCETQCTVVSATEICNGIDDNCNGSVDEGFDCPMNKATSCTTTCGSIGSGTCGLNCRRPEAAQCTPPAETCNGVDDDCNGAADNGFPCARGTEVDCTTACGTPGRGTCTSACALPAAAACAGGAEVCNGLDDNCNGGTDETFGCARGATVTCLTSCNSTGSGRCKDDCTVPAGTQCTAPAETCNGVDDDCNGVCDNGVGEGCCRGATGTCITSCSSTGSRTCSSTCTWGSCTPPAETCNGRDDDCNGACDNGVGDGCCRGSSGTCTTSCGSSGSRLCSNACTWGSCTPPAETCNGVDDDCNGVCDNGVGDGCCRGATGTCGTTCGSTGTRTCSTSCTWGACTPPAETCNGADDDCDGVCDDGVGECCKNASRSCSSGLCTGGTQTCSSSCAWGTCSFGSAPAHDTCSGAIDVGGGGTFTGTTCAAANNYSSGSCGGSGNDVVYRVTVPVRSTVTADTCATSSAWDTVLYLRGSCTGSDVACSDDSSLCPSSTLSSLTATVDAGTYYLFVDGWSSSSMGPYTLTVSVRPVNDTCANAIDMSSLSSTSGNTTGATDDTGSACAGSAVRGVWYRFTLSQQEVVYLDTLDGQSWDSVLTVKSGSCTGTNVLCADDACSTSRSQGAFLASAGTYYVLVSGYFSSDYGPFTLRYLHSRCPGATQLSNGSNSGTTSGAGNDTGPWCASDNSAPDRPYFFAGCSGRSYSMSTCSGTTWDTVLYTKSGGGGTCGSTNVNCEDDDTSCGPQSSYSGTLPSNNLYFTIVDGYFSSSYGSYTLTATY